jgi:hypothetical protein
MFKVQYRRWPLTVLLSHTFFDFVQESIQGDFRSRSFILILAAMLPPTFVQRTRFSSMTSICTVCSISNCLTPKCHDIPAKRCEVK